MSLTLIFQFLILTFVVSGVLIFFLKKALFDSTQGAVNRLNKETESVRAKQAELNEKIKLANEELEKRKKEADALAQKMSAEAEEKAKQEREKVLSKTRQEGDEIIAKAIRTKDEMRKAVQKEMEMKMVDFTVDILTVVLSGNARKALDEYMTAEFLEELKKTDMTMINPDVKTIEITMAVSPTEQFKNRLSQMIKEKLNREVAIDAKVDPKVVSGAVIRFGSLVLDGSLSNLMMEKGIALKEKVEKG